MPTKLDGYRIELRELIPQALQSGDNRALESYLMERSDLPGPRGNLELIGAFADVIGEIVTQPDPPVAQIESLLDGWAALPLEAAPVNDPRELLPAMAALAYGQVAAVRAAWWQDEIAKLRKAAADPRWRTREIVAAGLQRMLAANWSRTYAALVGWLQDDNPLVIRAVAAGVAEPRLYIDQSRGQDALAIQDKVIQWLMALPAFQRRFEDVRTLRQALGYTLSVAVVPVPDEGFALLERLAQTDDPDVRWIVRENLKKNRLSPWPDRVEKVRAFLS